MRKFLLLFMLGCLLQKNSPAQDTNTTQDTTTTFTLRYIVTTLPSQYLFGDYPVKVEYLFRRQSVGIILGYKPATSNGGHLGDKVVPQYVDMNIISNVYNAVTVGLSTKFFFKKKGSAFIEGEVFYRHWWFDDKEYSFSLANAYRFSGIRTERQEVRGGKIVFGITHVSSSTSRIKWVLEPFIGVGLRFKSYHFETRNGTVNDRHYDYYAEDGSWQEEEKVIEEKAIGRLKSITPQAGIRFGIGF